MKKLLAICTLFLFVGCATFDTEGTKSELALGKDTGDTVTADDFDDIDEAVTDNSDRIDTIEALTGPVFSDGDGTYTDMSAISSTELGLLDGLTGPIYESGDEDTIVAAMTAGALPADSVFPEDLDQDGTYTLTGVLDFGGATSVEIPNGTDPDVDAAGEISADTDGANVANDFIIRAFDGTNQFPVASRNIAYQHTFNAAGAVTDDPVWYNDTGMTFNIEYIIVNCDDNTVTITLDEYTSFTNITHLTEIDSLLVDSAGTGIYYTSACASGCTEAADIAHKVIETGHGVFAAYSGAGVGTILLRGYFDADVD